MNEQIQKLMLEAGYAAPELAGRANKLAELIIQECIELNRQELAFSAFERMLNKYKEHFGVE